MAIFLRVCIITFSFFSAILPVNAQGVGATGRVVRADDGQWLVFCSSPGLSVKIQVDSLAGGSMRMASGTAELVGENFGIHSDVDEVIYFLSEKGRFALAADTFNVSPGTVMFVPQGVRHGFISDGGQPLRFFWVITPGSLAARFRQNGKPDVTHCAAKL